MYPIDFMRHGAQQFPDKIAVVDDVNRQLTYRELMRQADAFASGLQKLANKDRVKVGFCCLNNTEHALSLMAVHAMGGIWMPFNPAYGKGELDALISYAKPDLMICDEECLAQMEGFDMPIVIGEKVSDSNLGFPTQAELVGQNDGQRPTWPKVSPADAMAIKFTGGSSGVPKGVVQSFRMKSAVITNLIYSFELNDEDIHLGAAPISHAVGSLLDPIFAVGGTNRLVKSVKADFLLDCIEKEKISMIFTPPTLVYNLIEEGKKRDDWDFSNLKHLISGGAPISPKKAEEASEFFQGGFEMMFGQSEMPLVVSVMRNRDLTTPERYTSAGRITPFVRVSIKDLETGEFLPAGEQGEIVAQSDMMMTEYLDMPEKTAETIIDGWLHTGDVGLIDEDGFLYIKDRIRDVIISGGFNVYPTDVEAALMQHPAIHEAAVVGMPDEKWGERVESAIEFTESESASEEDIIAFCKEKMGSIKSPKKIHFMDSLPQSSVGKVSRKDVKAMLLGEG